VIRSAYKIATDASKHFSSRILPYVERLVSGKSHQDEIEFTLQRAKIVDKGRITAEHSWLAPRVEAWRNTEDDADRPLRATSMPAKKKRVLLLGSGLVAGPAVDVFVARRDIELVIG
jgi:alpha-aminoadipic semialdehyde synthase